MFRLKRQRTNFLPKLKIQESEKETQLRKCLRKTHIYSNKYNLNITNFPVALRKINIIFMNLFLQHFTQIVSKSKN